MTFATRKNFLVLATIASMLLGATEVSISISINVGNGSHTVVAAPSVK